MEEQTPFPKPQFLISTRDEAIKLGLEQFGNDLTANPEKYLPIVYSVGEMAVISTTDDVYELDGDRAGKVRHYFTYGHDLDVDYDDATELALKTDETYKSLVEARKRVSRKDEPEQASELEQQLQRRRLAFFIGRLIAYNANQSENLRSAG